jgi:hypothetical protein
VECRCGQGVWACDKRLLVVVEKIEKPRNVKVGGGIWEVAREKRCPRLASCGRVTRQPGVVDFFGHLLVKRPEVTRAGRCEWSVT